MPVKKYKSLSQGPDHLGWAAKIIGFTNGGKKVKLQVKGEAAYGFDTTGSSPYALDKLLRLT